MTPMVSPQDAAKLLKDMGFTNVSILEGGTNGWKQAGLPTYRRPRRELLAPRQPPASPRLLAGEGSRVSADLRTRRRCQARRRYGW